MADQKVDVLDTTPHPRARRAFWMVTGAVLGGWWLHNLVLLPWERAQLDGTFRALLTNLLRAAVWLIPTSYYLQRYDARPPGEALGLTSRLAPRGCVLGAIPALAYLALSALLQGISEPLESFGASVLRWENLSMLVTVVLEEILMRGFVLGQLARFMRGWKAQLVTAGLFAGMHLPGWVVTIGLDIALLPMSISVFLLGVVLGIVARKSNSIWPAIALHFLNNLLADWLTAALRS